MRWALFLPLLLCGCVESTTGSVYYDGRFWWSTVKSASDIAGGPRQDVVVVIDRDGRIVGQFQASGSGTLQALVGSFGPALVTAAGTAAAGALQRPSRNTTNVNMEVQGTGGSGGSGGSNTTSTTASGGAGGVGGAGGSVNVGQ